MADKNPTEQTPPADQAGKNPADQPPADQPPGDQPPGDQTRSPQERQADLPKQPPSDAPPEELNDAAAQRAEVGREMSQDTPPSWREMQLQDAMRYVPAPRNRRVPTTALGPLEPDEVMTESELWQRAEMEHLQRNQSELERAASQSELIIVESNLNNDRVAFSELDDRHPHGHTYIAGQDSPPQIVARTEGIEQAILDRKIRVVRDNEGVLARLRRRMGADDEEEAKPRSRRR